MEPFVGSITLMFILLNVKGLKTQGLSRVDHKNPQGINISILNQRLKKVSLEMP
jgi:hypothetical protein